MFLTALKAFVDKIGLVNILYAIAAIVLVIIIWSGYNRISDYMDEHDRLKTENALYERTINDLESDAKLDNESYKQDLQSIKDLLDQRTAERDALQSFKDEYDEAEEKGFLDVVQPSVAAGKADAKTAKCELPPGILFTFDSLRKRNGTADTRD